MLIEQSKPREKPGRFGTATLVWATVLGALGGASVALLVKYLT